MFLFSLQQKLILLSRQKALRFIFNGLPTQPPSNLAGKLKIHLGAGDVFIPGYINVDARDLPNIHLSKDNLLLDEFSDESIGEIYACHVLEHISHLELDGLLSHFRKKLCNGGVIRLSVPDFEALAQAYVTGGKDLQPIYRALMGGQEYKTNFHYSVFDKRFLSELLERNGFNDIRAWNTKDVFGGSIGDWSDQTIPYSGQQIHVSLNIEARKS